MDFSDPEFVFHRATRVWGWRKPTKGEGFVEYRKAFARYVALSDPDEAKALEQGAVFTKFDAPISVVTLPAAPAVKRPLKAVKPEKKRAAIKMSAGSSGRKRS